MVIVDNTTCECWWRFVFFLNKKQNVFFFFKKNATQRLLLSMHGLSNLGICDIILFLEITGFSFLFVSFSNLFFRKILVVDEKTAFCGGMNISRHYVSPALNGSGIFRDTHLRVRGLSLFCCEKSLPFVCRSCCF